MLACHLVERQTKQTISVTSPLSGAGSRSLPRGSLLPLWGIQVPVAYISVSAVSPMHSISQPCTQFRTHWSAVIAFQFETTSPSPMGAGKEHLLSYPPHPCSTDNTTKLVGFSEFLFLIGTRLVTLSPPGVVVVPVTSASRPSSMPECIYSGRVQNVASLCWL